MIKKIILIYLVTLPTMSVFSMEQSDYSSLSKDITEELEELPMNNSLPLPQDVRKLIVLNCNSIEDIKSFLEVNKENEALFKDPQTLSYLLTVAFNLTDTASKKIKLFLEAHKENKLPLNDPKILSYLLTLIFNLDDAVREELRLLLEANKENKILLNDSKIVGLLITRIAEAYAQEAEERRTTISHYDLNGNFSHVERGSSCGSAKYLQGFDDFIGFVVDKEDIQLNLFVSDVERELYNYTMSLECQKIRVAARLGTKSAVKWLKEYATKDNSILARLTQILMQDYLLETIKNSKVEAVKFLLKSGVNVTIKDSKGNTPFALVREKNRKSPSPENTEIANILSKTEGIDLSDNIAKYTVEEKFSKSKHLGFHRFIQQFQHKEAQALLDDWVDTNVKDHLGNTPLITAILCGNWRIALILIEKGADLNAINSEGKTALELANQQTSNKIINAARAKIAEAIRNKLAKASDDVPKK